MIELLAALYSALYRACGHDDRCRYGVTLLHRDALVIAWLLRFWLP